MRFLSQKSWRFWGLMLVLLLFSVGFKVGGDLFEVSRNMEIFAELYTELNKSYVDETDPTRLMRTAIDSMLYSLDPYTNYYSESQIDESKLIRTGQYSGIGAEIGFRKGQLLLLQLFEDGPADKAGLNVGDEILQVDQIDVSEGKRKLDEIENLLSGERGTDVKVLIRRNGETATEELSVTRGGQNEAQQENVPYFGMANDTIGYILVTGFTANAGQEVANAFSELKRDNPRLNRMILDFRGNLGGRLQEAVNIVNVFVPKGQKIVEMRGRTYDTQREFSTINQALDENIPLVVLINERSASASEIVAGSIQDLDRGVLVGTRSFGKGLVQNVRPLSFNTQMKITVAKYYTPSGRCIQALDYSNRLDDGTVTKVADSLISEFETRNGRKVFDGEGVEPDLAVEHPKLKPVSQALVDQGIIFDFVSLYQQENEKIPEPRVFVLEDEVYDQFVEFVEQRGFQFETLTEQQLTKMRQALTESGFTELELQTALSEIETNLKVQKSQDLITHQAEIRRLLKKEIITRYYYKQGVIEASFEDDPDLLEAYKILNDLKRYQQILGLES
ncbi:MAG: S41 family peptidase [Bacteroidota bacterium]